MTADDRMVTVSADDLAEAIDHLDGVWDDGPPEAGWASNELITLRDRLRATLAPAPEEGPEEEQRLYGIVGAEELFFDPAEAYESQIDGCVEPEGRVEIEEFDVHPPRYHLPDPDRLLEWVAEWAADMGELDEGADASLGGACDLPEVKAAADAILDVLASRVTYRMANNHLRSLWVTWNDQGEPLLDGEPMYVARSDG